MKQLLDATKSAMSTFSREDDGAQVVEYALVIALVSIALAIALSALDLNINTLSTRIADCLSGGTCTA